MSGSSSAANAAHYYLSLGDSLAAGQQPIGDPEDRFRTADGYADQLYAIARDRDPTLRHVKLGCPGETTVTMIEGGICEYEHGSQLATALALLEAHAGSVSLVTIDIGWNDFPRTIEGIPEGSASVRAHLPEILLALTRAAPGVPIVGLNIYDPFLAHLLDGTTEGTDLAMRSLDLIAGTGTEPGINDLVEGIYRQFGIPVADVEGAFHTTDVTTQVPLAGVGLVPLNVATICRYTWMCAPPPLGPDDHPTHDGYRAMALAITNELGWS